MKLCAYVVLLLFSIGILGASELPEEKRGIKRPAEQEIAIEPAAKEQKVDEYPLASLMGAPEEIRKHIFDYLYTAKGATNQIRLVNAAQNIRNFLMSKKEFKADLNNVQLAGTIIKELTKRYAGQNFVIAAVALATDAASKWLATQFSDARTQSVVKALLNDAARDNDIGIINFILQYASHEQSDVFLNALLDDTTPLIVAARNNHPTIVKRLLALGATNINVQDLEGWTALMWAAYKGHLEIAKQLLAKGGINVNLLQKHGMSALMLARASANPNKEAIIKLLIEHGAAE